MTSYEFKPIKDATKDYDRCSYEYVSCCYANGNGEKRSVYNRRLKSMERSDALKYFEIIKDSVRGTINKNAFVTGFSDAQKGDNGLKQILKTAVREPLNEENTIELFDRIIPTISFANETNYFITVSNNTIDYKPKTSDRLTIDDASEFSFSYIIVAICPAKLSDPGLAYDEESGEFRTRVTDWVAGSPFMSFVYPVPAGNGADMDLTDQIERALDSTENQPDFVFTVSVQGHGSYPSEQLIQDPAIKVLSCGENVEKYAVEYYVNQVHEMDEFIGQLTDMLANRDEKTVLVLYGDHLPSLDLTRDEMRSGSLFRTEYVIWDNFGLAKKTENLTSYRLAAVTLERLNIIGGNMCRFQQNCYGDLNYEQELRLIQYDTLFGKNYLNGGNSPYEATVMKMGLQPIAVNSLRQGVDGYWYLYGKNFTPFCKATVGENILSTKYISGTCLRIKEDPGTDRAEDIYITVLDKHKEVLGTSLEQ